MPTMNRYQCNKCDFYLPGGYGGYVFVENDKGERIRCLHPGERMMINEVLKGEYIKERIGFASACLCLDCLHKFEADLADEKGKLTWRNYYKGSIDMIDGRDKRECPKCKSKKVKTVSELIDEPCPKCKEGIIKEIETGIWS